MKHDTVKVHFTIGIDEVGRGPIAGPVMICAFLTALSDKELLALFPNQKLRESKKLSPKRREEIFEKLSLLQKKGKVAWHTAARSAAYIDSNGINSSIRACTEEGLATLCLQENLQPSALKIFLDGELRAPSDYIHQETIIKGDEKVTHVACASIIAKVTRDRLMKEFGKEYPAYGFERHVGYGTVFHYEAIKEFGETALHRKTFLKKHKKQQHAPL